MDKVDSFVYFKSVVVSWGPITKGSCERSPYIPCGYFGFPLLLLFQQCSILSFNTKLLLKEEQTGEPWEPPNKSDTLSEIEEYLRKKRTFREFTFSTLVFKVLKIIFGKFFYP